MIDLYPVRAEKGASRFGLISGEVDFVDAVSPGGEQVMPGVPLLPAAGQFAQGRRLLQD